MQSVTLGSGPDLSAVAYAVLYLLESWSNLYMYVYIVQTNRRDFAAMAPCLLARSHFN